MAMGGILRWKDGRNMPDVHASMYQYGELPVYMRLNLGTEMPETYRFQGSKGVLEVSGRTIAFSPQSGLDESPSYYAYSFPRALRDQYFKQWHAEDESRLFKASMPESLSFPSPDFGDS